MDLRGWLSSVRLRALLFLSVLRAKGLQLYRRTISSPGLREPPPSEKRRDAVNETDSAISLGRVSFDLRLAGRQLRNDLRDDWFPDPLNYTDMLGGETLRRLIETNIESNGGQYVPGRRTLFNIPKTGFTLRYALETGLSDRALYHGLTSELIPHYDSLIPWNAFSHRFDHEGKRSSERYTFMNGIEAWKSFVGSTRSALTPSSYLVSTDVANFFEHIQLDRLRQRMQDLAPLVSESEEIRSRLAVHRDILFQFLNEWSYEPGRGLPQNRDASSFLANLYMRDIDLSMIEAGYKDTYFRYMDDIKIVCDDLFQARRALKELSTRLRELGLTLNSRKTVITAASDVKAIDECLDEGSDAIQQIDQLWRRRTRSAIFSLWPVLRDRVLQLIQEGKVDCREFRYCIRRIALLSRFRDLHFPASLYAPITTAICHAVATHPACTDQYVEYLASVDVGVAELAPVIEYLADPAKSIYTWQNYRLWLLLAQKELRDEQLLAAARHTLTTADTPARAGATVFLGVVGSDQDRLDVASRFSELTSFLGQRSALIALHEQPYPRIRDFVTTMRSDLHGVYRGLNKSSSRGTYFVAREDLRIELGGVEEASYA